MEINNLHFSNTLENGVFSLNKFNFNAAGGNVNLSAWFLQNDDLSIEGHFYSKGKRLSIKPLIMSFGNNGLRNGSYGDIEGYVSYTAEGLIKMDSLLKIISDQNLFYTDIFIEEGKIINNPQIDTTISFVGHRAKENIVINGSEFQIYINGTDLIVKELLVNNNISYMNVFGKYYMYDSALNMDFKINLTDLFFRTKKKRYLDTSRGKTPLAKDASVFIEFDDSSEKPKIKVHSKKEHRLRRKELLNELTIIHQEYVSRLNTLSLKAEPKLIDTNISLKSLNKKD